MTDQHLLARPGFWAACFQDEYAPGVPDDEDYDHAAEYDVGGGYALTMECGEFGATLGLSYPGAAKPVELGWDDLAHWHPHALRWPELDLVCRAAALTDPTTPTRAECSEPNPAASYGPAPAPLRGHCASTTPTPTSP